MRKKQKVTFVLCYGDLGGARHELVSVFWLAVTGASCLQVLWLLKDDAISGLYGYHRWILCSGIQCVAMQTLPAASVKFSLEDVRNPSRLNGGGGNNSLRWRRGGWWTDWGRPAASDDLFIRLTQEKPRFTPTGWYLSENSSVSALK